MQKQLDIAANIAIIGVALLIAVTLFRQHLIHTQANKDVDSVETALESSLSQGKHMPPPAGYQWE
jgi:hypothetical protein